MDRGILLKTMAEDLHVTPSFLSAVEVGKKSVPDRWVDEIASLYNLSQEERSALRHLALEAATNVKINMMQSNRVQRQAAMTFARCFDSLTEEEARQIISFLHKGN